MLLTGILMEKALLTVTANHRKQMIIHTVIFQ